MKPVPLTLIALTFVALSPLAKAADTCADVSYRNSIFKKMYYDDYFGGLLRGTLVKLTSKEGGYQIKSTSCTEKAVTTSGAPDYLDFTMVFERPGAGDLSILELQLEAEWNPFGGSEGGKPRVLDVFRFLLTAPALAKQGPDYLYGWDNKNKELDYSEGIARAQSIFEDSGRMLGQITKMMPEDMKKDTRATPTYGGHPATASQKLKATPTYLKTLAKIDPATHLEISWLASDAFVNPALDRKHKRMDFWVQSHAFGPAPKAGDYNGQIFRVSFAKLYHGPY